MAGDYQIVCFMNNFVLRYLLFFVFAFTIGSCSSKAKSGAEQFGVVYTEKDKELLQQIFELFSEEANSSTPVLMVKLGTYFFDTPYVGQTLEKEGEEQLVVNLFEMDCTTLVENCLAIAKTIQSGDQTFEKFTHELKNIRYRSGKIDGYPSRLHYTTDWMFDNQQKKLVRNITKEIGGTEYLKEINFMSTHPDSYRQLKDNAGMVQAIEHKEKEINSRHHYYILVERLPAAESRLTDGDIAGITTTVGGLDVTHMGILVNRGGRIHLLHASSSAGKVLLSEETLEEYLLNSKSATGIIVARPQ